MNTHCLQLVREDEASRERERERETLTAQQQVAH